MYTSCMVGGPPLVHAEPDRTGDVAVVLTGGGARAAYQVGFLRWIARHIPAVNFPIITGVSAGAINAAYIAAFPGTQAEAIERLASLWQNLSVDQVFRVDTSSLLGNMARWGFGSFPEGARLLPRCGAWSIRRPSGRPWTRCSHCRRARLLVASRVNWKCDASGHWPSSPVTIRLASRSPGFRAAICRTGNVRPDTAAPPRSHSTMSWPRRRYRCSSLRFTWPERGMETVEFV